LLIIDTRTYTYTLSEWQLIAIFMEYKQKRIPILTNKPQLLLVLYHTTIDSHAFLKPKPLHLIKQPHRLRRVS